MYCNVNRPTALHSRWRLIPVCDAQVVWVNYQIMATVSWNVQIVFPEPFRTLERLFSLLDLSLLRIMPINCLIPYDFISDFYVRLWGFVDVLYY